MSNYVVSARRYRPVIFQSVVGQKSLIITLKNAIQNNKLAHAYIFCGPRGVGKTTCARIFAKTINCTHLKKDGEACNKCESCQSFNENRSYNIYELDAASNNSVDDIRSLTEKIRIPPQMGGYKVYIIDEVHMLSTSAFNAFLKTLEEPPYHSIFILATTEKHKIIPTILSRCQIYDFSRITINDIVGYLEYVAKNENISTEREALNVIAQKADGGMRDALSIFDQIVNFSAGNVTYQSVIENLNILDYEYYFRLVDATLVGNVSCSLLILNEIIKKGFDGQQIIGGLAEFFRNVMVCKDPQTIVLFEIGDNIVKEKYLNLAKQCTNNFLYRALELSNECDLNYRNSKNKRLLIELLFIRLCQLNYQLINNKKVVIETLVAKESNAVKQEQTVINEEKSDIGSETSKFLLKTNQLRFSLKKNTTENTNDKSEKTDCQQQSVFQEKFTQQDLEKVWRRYIDKETNLHLKYAILNIVPKLQENNCIQIVVFNFEQQNELSNRESELKDFLSQQLKNNQIKLEITIVKNKQNYSFYTNKEKFEFLAKKNPVLTTLVKTFNLRY